MLVPLLKKWLLYWRSEETITSSDHNLTLQEASKHRSVSVAKDVNWLRIWEVATDKGSYWARTLISMTAACHHHPLILTHFCLIWIHQAQNHLPTCFMQWSLLSLLIVIFSQSVVVMLHNSTVLCSRSHKTVKYTNPLHIFFRYMCIMEKDPCRGVVFLTVLCDHPYLVLYFLPFCYPYIL